MPKIFILFFLFLTFGLLSLLAEGEKETPHELKVEIIYCPS